MTLIPRFYSQYPFDVCPRWIISSIPRCKSSLKVSSGLHLCPSDRTQVNFHILFGFSFLLTPCSQLQRPMLLISTATGFLQPSMSKVFITHRSKGYGIGSSPCSASTSRKSSNKGKSPAYTILAILFTHALFHSLSHTSKFKHQINRQLFNWIWPQILQHQLDKFFEYWNNHKICFQSTKPNMSGQTPRHTFTVPQAPAEECRIEVPQDAIDALRNTIPVSCDKAMQWVDPAQIQPLRKWQRGHIYQLVALLSLIWVQVGLYSTLQQQ